jgi:hypothetical protein
MDFTNGYRLRIKSIREISDVLDGFRADATKILAREFGRSVAAETIRRLDLATIGHVASDSNASPIQDGYDAVCSAYLSSADGFAEIDCELAFHFVKDAVLAHFVSGAGTYRKSWEGRKEVVKWGWSERPQRPRGVSEERWKAREAFWRAAMARPGIGAGLRFKLIDGKPPQIGWNGIRRFIPGMEDRIRTVLSAIHEGSAETTNRTKLAELKRSLATTLVRDPTKADISSYEQERRPSQSIRSIAHSKASASVGVSHRDGIDHADIVKASDGRIFVAVPYVGLDTEDRVFLQVADNEIVITQNAKQFGHVGNVSRSAVDLLRECKTVTMVEVEIAGGKRLLRAKHVAIVKDISLTENVSRLFGQWRVGKGKGSRGDGEIKQWESQQ